MQRKKYSNKSMNNSYFITGVTITIMVKDFTSTEIITFYKI